LLFVIGRLHVSLTSRALGYPLRGRVAIGNLERHMRKASHCGSKQQ